MTDGARTFGERVADRVVSFWGSWLFIGLFCGTMAAWIGLNSGALARILFGSPVDPYPYILWNLILSTMAALQGSLILLSQKRSDKKRADQLDRVDARVARMDNRIGEMYADHQEEMAQLREICIATHAHIHALTEGN